MKPALLFFFFLPHFLFAQDAGSFQRDMKAIPEMEKKAVSSLFSKEVRSAASANFDVHHYRCQWEINPAARFIKGAVTPSFTMTATGNTIALDMSQALIIDSVVYHGNKIAFQQQAVDVLSIQFPADINAGVKDSVSIFYHGVPSPSAGLGSFVQNQHAGVPIIWTLSEPYGAKIWWPCKDNLADKADSMDIFITNPSAYTASSIGVMMSRQVVDTFATTHFRHRYPVASYLVALAVTNYLIHQDTVTVNNKTYPFITYYYPEAPYFFDQRIYGKNACRIYTQLFGEYPFAKEQYAHTQWGWGGGMEHQTNSFMSNSAPALSAHELGHQWFGDRVTCGSWSHIWLNEGFATYASGLYTQVYHPRFYRGFLEQTLASATSLPDGAVYVADTTDVNRIFSARLSYNKGAYVVHMLRWLLGDSVLFRGLRQYLADPAVSYGFARTEDLERNLEQVSGKDLTVFFQNWIYKEGYPNYQAEWSQNINKWAKVKLSQTTSHPSVKFYSMPVMLEFRSANDSLRVVVDHQYSGQEFNVQLHFVPDTLIIDPDLWLLSRVKTSKKIAAPSSPDIIQLYPNPAPRNALLTVRNPSGSKLYVRLFNAAGQLLYSREINTTGRDEDVPLPLSQQPRGTYLLDIRNDKNMKVTRRIVH
jgi:aminopeptidase N